ncbi:MAG: plastocyanin/azurin family copper-binding protein [Patescibacteria group bacterium]
MKKNVLIPTLVVLALIGGGWYYFSHKSPEIETPKEQASDTAPETTNTPAAGVMETGEIPADTTSTGTGAAVDVTATVGVKTFTITGSNFSFTPKTLSIKKGDHVKITFVNSNGTHNLKIDAFSVATPMIGSGESATVEFVASKAGSFEYYCSVGNHRAMGMVGTLTVTE